MDYHSSGNSKRRHSDNSYHKSHPKRSRPESDKRTLGIKDYKVEISRFIEDYLAIRNPHDFWKFYDKYEALQSLKSDSDFDRRKLYNISFKESSEKLYDKLPVLDRRGNRIQIDLGCFERFLQCVVVYLDFEQKSKFNKLKLLRKSQKELPIYEFKQTILQTLEKHNVLLIAGDTGCGKSTQVPQYIMEDTKYKKIVVTQPRRIACVSLSKRVSYESLTDFKSTIGYQIRFERTKTKATKVVFMTEGLLLRQVQDADVMESYDVIILDEVHERHLHCDFLVGIMKCLIQKQKFKLILMSATINIELYANYFKTENCQVIEVPGRLYPIDIIYNNKINDPYDKKSNRRSDRFDCGPYINILEQIDNKFKPHEKGDVLVFLNGYSEIAALSEAVETYAELNKHWIVLQLHGSLSLEEQDKVFDYPPDNCRKCIISTNIAETSVTIDGIRFVIDSGKVNRMTYENNTAINRLKECCISKDSAKQRSGRAGRTGPGYCYRLYSELQYDEFDEYTPAEIKLVPLESLVLQMVALGLSDINNYPFLEKPEAKVLAASLERLRYCGALKLLDKELSLTALGDALSKIPVNLTVGKQLLVSAVFGQVTAVFPMAALLSVQTPITQRSLRDFKMIEARKTVESDHGDVVSLLNFYKSWLELKVDRENSRKWSLRFGLEEQRFYEATKLIDQFKSILDEAKIVLKPKMEELTGAERSIRHGELKQLRDERRHLKNSSKTTRKVLSLNDSADKAQGSDIRDVEFRIKNDFDSMRGLLRDVSATSHKQLTILKIIVASGFYPQVAVPDEFNHMKSDKLYHTPSKAFVFLRPECYFTRDPDILELATDDIDAPPEGYFSKRPVSNRHQLLIYQTLLETKKTFLVNVMRMPALQTMLLFACNVCVNRTLTAFVFDDFLLIHCPFYGQGKVVLMKALRLRKTWDTKLESVLSGETNINEEENFDFLEDLYTFMRIDVRYNLKRLLPADLNFLYRKFNNLEEYTTLASFKVTDNDCRNPFDCDFRPVMSNQFGGVQVTSNMHFDSLVDEEWSLVLEQNVLGSQITCEKCQKEYYVNSMLEILHHEFIDCIEKKDHKEQVVKLPQSTKSANTKEYLCPTCNKCLVLSPVEILRHKKSCSL